MTLPFGPDPARPGDSDAALDARRDAEHHSVAAQELLDSEELDARTEALTRAMLALACRFGQLAETVAQVQQALRPRP